MSRPVTKAIIPVAGYGTRFLPYTKSIPKEMLPIVDQPVIHHIAAECAAAGITEIILITGMNKRAIEDYFDYNAELEQQLEKSGKHAQRQVTRDVADLATFVYVRQKEQLGNGHAVLQAKGLIDHDEPFVVMWGDEMYMGEPNKLQQMIAAYEKHNHPVFLTMEQTEAEDYKRYGYVDLGESVGDHSWKVAGVVEKPGSAEKAPSNQAALGCYILTGDFFEYLETQQPGTGGEIVLAEALSRYTADKTVIAHEATGLKYFDCGNKLEYMKATVEYSLLRDDIGADFKEYLKHLTTTL
jgi:UTP--glucose-1-phosphate uridylyltransferase